MAECPLQISHSNGSGAHWIEIWVPWFCAFGFCHMNCIGEGSVQMSHERDLDLELVG